MDRVFNMGVGMIAVVSEDDAAAIHAAAETHGMESWSIGAIQPGSEVRYR